jgi:hypothetical protein
VNNNDDDDDNNNNNNIFSCSVLNVEDTVEAGKTNFLCLCK